MNLLARLHSLVVGLGAAAALATFATAANAQTKWDLPAAFGLRGADRAGSGATFEDMRAFPRNVENLLTIYLDPF